MVSIRIDGKKLEVPEGSYLLQAAQSAGVEIPALCHYDGLEHFTSCMVCIVKDADTGRLLPSCSVLAEEGMDIVTLDDEIFQTRKAALELLLSDHTGDCQAPCQLACPAHMEIPLMNRLLAEGRVEEALHVIERDIPLPSVLGRICNAPCEGACRRKTIDEPVSVCLLKRYAGDFGKKTGRNAGATPSREAIISAKTMIDQAGMGTKTVTEQAGMGAKTASDQAGTEAKMNSSDAARYVKGSKTGKVAVIGAGPAGLTAAFYLQKMGHQVKLVDRNEKAGGLLYEARPGDEDYLRVLDREVNQILAAGIEFIPGTRVDERMFNDLLNSNDAVILATGEMGDQMVEWGPERSKTGFVTDRASYRTAKEKIFAIGNAIRPVRSAVRSVGHGKEVAASVDQLINKMKVTGYPKYFNSRFGKLIEEEFSEYLKESIPDKRLEPEKGEQKGYTLDEVKMEASRCMHCDCRDIHTCKLRIFSDGYKTDQRRFKPENRKSVKKVMVHETIIYEPEKCIKCGICVRLTEQSREKYGFTFIGRGFDVRIGIPFDDKLGEELNEFAVKVAIACPTGALAVK